MGLRMGLALVLAVVALAYSGREASADYTPTAVPTVMATATSTAIPTSTSTAVATTTVQPVIRGVDVTSTEVTIWGYGFGTPVSNQVFRVYVTVQDATSMTRWVVAIPGPGDILNTRWTDTEIKFYRPVSFPVSGELDVLSNGVRSNSYPYGQPATATVVPTATTVQQPAATLGYERGSQWQRGETRMLQLSLSSPSPVYQWQGGQFTSTCGVVDLPGGFYSELNLRQLSYGWYVTVPATAPLGKCTIDGSVFLLGVGTTLRFYTELKVVEAQTPTATVVPTSTATPIGSPTPRPTSTPISTATPNPNAGRTELRPPTSYLAGQVIEIPVFVKSYGQEVDGGEFDVTIPEYPVQIVTGIVFSPTEGIIELPDGRATPLKRLVAYGSLYRTLHDGEQVGVLRLTTNPDAQNHLVVNVRRNILARGGASLGTSPDVFHVIRLTMGDANADGIVSILDFSLLVNSFNLHAGQPGFDARTDFNADGAVSILDFSVLASHFGRQVPGLG